MQEISGKNVKQCPNCHCSFDEIRRTGLFGCPECFIVFREEALSMVLRTQGTTRHGGKSPSGGAGERYKLALERERLRGEFERAVREGRYADAEENKKQLIELSHLIYGGKS